MGEQELFMISDERAKDENGASNMIKKHANVEKTIDNYADTIRQLSERSRYLIDNKHPDRWVPYRLLCRLFHLYLFWLFLVMSVFKNGVPILKPCSLIIPFPPSLFRCTVPKASTMNTSAK